MENESNHNELTKNYKKLVNYYINQINPKKHSLPNKDKKIESIDELVKYTPKLSLPEGINTFNYFFYKISRNKLRSNEDKKTKEVVSNIIDLKNFYTKTKLEINSFCKEFNKKILREII